MSRDNFKYYYRINRDGEPIPGSNIKSRKRPMKPRFKELIPQYKLCCDPNIEEGNSSTKSTKFFVRLTEENTPISGSLRKMRYKPAWSKFQEVFIHDCCVTLVSIELSLSSSSIEEGDTSTITVTATYSDGTTKDVTGDTIFTTDNENVTIEDNIITGVIPGNSEISGTFEGETSSQTIEVTAIEPEPEPEQ